MSKISAIEILSVFLRFVFAAFCPLFAIWLYIMFQNPTSMLLDFFYKRSQCLFSLLTCHNDIILLRSG